MVLLLQYSPNSVILPHRKEVHNVNKNELLDLIESYKNETQSLFKEDSKTPATIGDLNRLAAQTYYVFKEILNNLN